MKLNKYLIYQHSKSPKILIIKDGFSFSNAFILSFFASFIIAKFSFLISLFLFTGFFSTDILEYIYKKTGYLLKDIIFAYSKEEAELNFFKKLTQ